MRPWGFCVAFVQILGLAGCTTSGGAADGDAVPADTVPADAPGDAVARPDPANARLDLLFVIEARSGTCSAQNALGEAVGPFVTRLREAVAADLRVAVVTTDGLTAGERGRFRNAPAQQFPLSCAEKVRSACLVDTACQDPALGFGDRGICDGPSDAANLYNLNGSLNAGCRFACQSDAECVAHFATADAAPQETARWECLMLGASAHDYGCVRNPDTADCPADLPTVAALPATLDAEQVAALLAAPAADERVAGLALSVGACAAFTFEQTPCAALPAADLAGRTRCAEACVRAEFTRAVRCLANVGADQSAAGALQSSLAAAWLALDPEGENAQQLCAAPPDPTALGDPAARAAAETLRAQCFRCTAPDGFGVAASDCTGGYGTECAATNPACRDFLRADALLLIVFLTDEDDCTLAEGKAIQHEDRAICALLGSADEDPARVPRDVRTVSTGWYTGDARYRTPLAPVAPYVERFRGLVADPQRLFVGVIGGDGDTCFAGEPEAARGSAERHAERYWCGEYQPAAGDACLAALHCYEAYDIGAAAAACIADRGEAARLDCYAEAADADRQAAVDNCVGNWQADPAEEELFTARPAVAAALRTEVCTAGEPLTPEAREVYRARYLFSALDPTNALRALTYVCEGPGRLAIPATRLAGVAEQLGDHGFRLNFCAAGGFAAPLEALAGDLAARLAP